MRDFAIDVIDMAAPHTLLDAWPAARAIYSITRRTMLILCAGHEISLARVGIAQKSGYGLRLMLQKPVLQPSGGKGSQCHAREDAGPSGTPCAAYCRKPLPSIQHMFGVPAVLTTPGNQRSPIRA